MVPQQTEMYEFLVLVKVNIFTKWETRNMHNHHQLVNFQHYRIHIFINLTLFTKSNHLYNSSINDFSPALHLEYNTHCFSGDSSKTVRHWAFHKISNRCVHRTSGSRSSRRQSITSATIAPRGTQRDEPWQLNRPPHCSSAVAHHRPAARRTASVPITAGHSRGRPS
jgi:hypothetical protein